jgi:hypothetical protein
MSGAVLVSVLVHWDLAAVGLKYHVPNVLRPYIRRLGVVALDFCSLLHPPDRIGVHENDNGVPTKGAPYSTMSYPPFHLYTFEPWLLGKQISGLCVDRMRLLL